MQVSAYNRTVQDKTRQDNTNKRRIQQRTDLNTYRNFSTLLSFKAEHLAVLTAVCCSYHRPDVKAADPIVLCNPLRLQIICLLYVAQRSLPCYLLVLFD